MKKIFMPLLMLIGGVAVGGGSAYGANMVLGPAEAGEADHEPEAEPTEFVEVERILAPLVHPDGQLTGYVAFRFGLEVKAEDAEAVTARLPILLHGINMRTYRTPMASGPDGLLPELTRFRAIVGKAAEEAFGKGVVREVAVMEAVPA